METVQEMNVVLPGLTLHVGVVEAVLELFELAGQLAPLARHGTRHGAVASRVVAQRLLRILDLRFQAHDPIEHLIQGGQGVAPREPGMELGREPGRIAAQYGVGLHRDRLGLGAAARAERDGVRAGNGARPGHLSERILFVFGRW